MTYGLGWFQQDYDGRAVDFHTGSIDGMVAIHGLVRDEHLGVYVLGNLDHAEVRHALMYSVFDRYDASKAASGRDWSADFLKLYADLRHDEEEARTKKEALHVAGTSPSLPPARFAGDYSEPLHGDVKVTHDGNALRLQYGAAFVGTLEHWHYNTFRATWAAAWRSPQLVTFTLDEDGKPAAVELMGARFTRKADHARSGSQNQR